MAHCNVFRHRFLPSFKALCMLALLCGLPAWGLENYRAVYEVEIRGIRAGEMTLDSITTAKTYRLDARTEPSRAAKMLGYGAIREHVHGRLQGGQILPERYEREMIGDEDYYLNYQYDAKGKQVQVQKGKSALTLDYVDGKQALDILSLITQALLDEEQGKMSNVYHLLSEDKLRTYQVRQLKDEQWKEKNGKVLDIKVYEQTNGGRKTLVYLAQNPLRLAKLQQLRDNEPRFSLKLLDHQIR
ncbi:MAG: DUF3108 domain-containing protein [Cardiobacteriaceae bacterium]|nr:DUF3108 domain-containing protein [Cardiobacteriaceae bacterium]